MANAVTRMTQDFRLSTVGTSGVEATVEETLVSPDIIEVREAVVKLPTGGRPRQAELPRRAGPSLELREGEFRLRDRWQDLAAKPRPKAGAQATQSTASEFQ